MGLVRSAKLPGHLSRFQSTKAMSGVDGRIIGALGGSQALHRRKNQASLLRIMIALAAELAYGLDQLTKATSWRSSPTDHVHHAESFAHFWELVLLLCNLRMLLQRLFRQHPRLGNLSHSTMGVLGMAASLASILRIYCDMIQKNNDREIRSSPSRTGTKVPVFS